MTMSTADTPRNGHRRGILVFLAIAFALSWLPFIPALFGAEPAGAFLMPIAPTIAAVVVRKWVTREGFGDAGLRPRLRHWRLYLLAAGWPILTTLVSVPLAILFGAAPDGFSMPWGVEGPGTLTLLLWLGISVVGAPMILRGTRLARISAAAALSRPPLACRRRHGPHLGRVALPVAPGDGSVPL
jgi:hypothetical protein